MSSQQFSTYDDYLFMCESGMYDEDSSDYDDDEYEAQTTNRPQIKKKKNKSKPIVPEQNAQQEQEEKQKVATKNAVETEEDIKFVKKTKKSKIGIPVATQKSIIDRIKWDDDLDVKDFTIGYLDRFSGIIESDMVVHDFSEIPLHRIHYFKYKGTLVWDRKTKLNKFTDGTIMDLIKT
ncbi:Leng9 [Acrasis kona]|uniref:Leng9 n=1 Tax=Acrasis kona TaxID=1008807 RepID=A0AAW2Z7C5_9EUKA